MANATLVNTTPSNAFPQQRKSLHMKEKVIMGGIISSQTIALISSVALVILLSPLAPVVVSALAIKAIVLTTTASVCLVAAFFISYGIMRAISSASPYKKSVDESNISNSNELETLRTHIKEEEEKYNENNLLQTKTIAELNDKLTLQQTECENLKNQLKETPQINKIDERLDKVGVENEKLKEEIINLKNDVKEKSTAKEEELLVKEKELLEARRQVIELQNKSLADIKAIELRYDELLEKTQKELKKETNEKALLEQKLDKLSIENQAPKEDPIEEQQLILLKEEYKGLLKQIEDKKEILQGIEVILKEKDPNDLALVLKSTTQALKEAKDQNAHLETANKRLSQIVNLSKQDAKPLEEEYDRFKEILGKKESELNNLKQQFNQLLKLAKDKGIDTSIWLQKTSEKEGVRSEGEDEEGIDVESLGEDAEEGLESVSSEIRD